MFQEMVLIRLSKNRLAIPFYPYSQERFSLGKVRFSMYKSGKVHCQQSFVWEDFVRKYRLCLESYVLSLLLS
jgi:hypothetical protein